MENASYEKSFLTSQEFSQRANCLHYLKTHFLGYDFNPQKDEQYLKILEDQFPHHNLFDELKAFHIWTLDTDITTNYRSRFFKWLQKSYR